MCDNGLVGVQDPDSDVCCPLECGNECGGAGCGVIVGTDPSQCCSELIMASGQDCAVTGSPPCFDQSGELRVQKVLPLKDTRKLKLTCVTAQIEKFRMLKLYWS